MICQMHGRPSAYTIDSAWRYVYHSGIIKNLMFMRSMKLHVCNELYFDTTTIQVNRKCNGGVIGRPIPLGIFSLMGVGIDSSASANAANRSYILPADSVMPDLASLAGVCCRLISRPQQQRNIFILGSIWISPWKIYWWNKWISAMLPERRLPLCLPNCL